jgi:uncharacterized protein (UPF0332 family)
LTRENLRANVAAEVQRGDQSLAEAQQLLSAGFSYGAASRAYYGAFHHARALCLAMGHEPKSHSGVAHLFSLHFVKTGLLAPDTSRLFAVLQKFRESSDYDAAFVLDATGTAQAVADAKELMERAARWLRAEGLL